LWFWIGQCLVFVIAERVGTAAFTQRELLMLLCSTLPQIADETTKTNPQMKRKRDFCRTFFFFFSFLIQCLCSINRRDPSRRPHLLHPTAGPNPPELNNTFSQRFFSKFFFFFWRRHLSTFACASCQQSPKPEKFAFQPKKTTKKKKKKKVFRLNKTCFTVSPASRAKSSFSDEGSERSKLPKTKTKPCFVGYGFSV
jgi:hypothetical protein